MLSENIATRAAAAIVDFPNKGGRGVLVDGNLILTAAHCINYQIDGAMVLQEDGEWNEEIETGVGGLRVAPVAVEAVSDLAVLGSMDRQDFTEDAERFDKFCEASSSVPICKEEFLPFEEFHVYVYDLKKAWIPAAVVQASKYSPALWIAADGKIEPGMSGGPIVNRSGELVAIHAHSFGTVGTDGQSNIRGRGSRPHLAAPAWVCRRWTS